MQRVKGAVLSDGPFHSIPMGRVRSYFVRAHEPKGAQREKNVFQNPRSPAIGITHFTAPLEGSFHDISTSSAIRLLEDRKSTRLNSSHTVISYAVFCLKKKKITTT